MDNKSVFSKPAILFGGALILLGIATAISRLLNFSLGHYMWPFFIIIPGVLAVLGGLRSSGSSSEALLIVGSLVTITGMLLVLQTVTGLWASWAYAWALIAPTGVGLAKWLYGNKNNIEGKKTDGLKLTRIGLIIFAVGLIFFELILHISGTGIGYLVVAGALVVIGIIFLVMGLMKPKQK